MERETRHSPNTCSSGRLEVPRHLSASQSLPTISLSLHITPFCSLCLPPCQASTDEAGQDPGRWEADKQPRLPGNMDTEPRERQPEEDISGWGPWCLQDASE